MKEIFRVDNAAYSYPSGQAALEGVSLSVAEGEKIALLGANASGKSTLLSILDGLVFPTSGEAYAFGEMLSERTLDGTEFGRFFRRQVAFLFQNVDAQLFCSSVEEELSFGPRHLGMNEKEIKERTEDLVEVFRLEKIRTRAPQTLSGGEKRRVGLAAVLAVGPSVVMLDEPTSGLDPRNRAFLIDCLRELGDAGKTIVIATHDLELAHDVADRGIILTENHKVASDGPIHGILSSHELLERVNLVHVHTHSHEDVVHAHDHHHGGPHEHNHEH